MKDNRQLKRKQKELDKDCMTSLERAIKKSVYTRKAREKETQRTYSDKWLMRTFQIYGKTWVLGSKKLIECLVITIPEKYP